LSVLAPFIRIKSDLGAATGIALQTDSVWPYSEGDVSGQDKAIVLAGVRPRNKNQGMVLRGFEFLLNNDRPGIPYLSLQHVLIFQSVIFKLLLAIGSYKIALYPITRLVAVLITEMNGINTN
jgi:hypothetical protein